MLKVSLCTLSSVSLCCLKYLSLKLDEVVFHDRERKSASITCALALVSLEQTAGLIIPILQLLEEVILLLVMVMEVLFRYKVYHNHLYPHGLLLDH